MVTEKQQKLLGNVVKCCSQMEALIEDFLTLSRLEAGQLVLNMQKVELGSLAFNTVELSRPRFEQQELTGLFHHAEEPLEVMGDSIQLERVMNNLVGTRLSTTVRVAGSTSSAAARGSQPAWWLPIRDWAFQRMNCRMCSTSSAAVRRWSG